MRGGCDLLLLLRPCLPVASLLNPPMAIRTASLWCRPRVAQKHCFIKLRPVGAQLATLWWFALMHVHLRFFGLCHIKVSPSHVEPNSCPHADRHKTAPGRIFTDPGLNGLPHPVERLW